MARPLPQLEKIEPVPESNSTPEPETLASTQPLFFEIADFDYLGLPNELWIKAIYDIVDASSLCALLQTSKSMRRLVSENAQGLRFQGNVEKIQPFPRIVGLSSIFCVAINSASLKTDSLAYFPNLTTVLLTNCTGVESLVLPESVKTINIRASKLNSFKFLKTETPLHVQLHQVKVPELPLLERRALSSDLASIVGLDLADAAISLDDLVELLSIPSGKSFKRESGVWTGDITRALNSMTNLEDLVVGPVDSHLFEMITWEKFRNLKTLELNRNYQFPGLTHANNAIGFLQRCPDACTKSLTIVQSNEQLRSEIKDLLEGSVENISVSFVESCQKDLGGMPCNRLPYVYIEDYKRKLK